jgi:hypothetical protein
MTGSKSPLSAKGAAAGASAAPAAAADTEAQNTQLKETISSLEAKLRDMEADLSKPQVAPTDTSSQVCLLLSRMQLQPIS